MHHSVWWRHNLRAEQWWTSLKKRTSLYLLPSTEAPLLLLTPMTNLSKLVTPLYTKQPYIFLHTCFVIFRMLYIYLFWSEFMEVDHFHNGSGAFRMLHCHLWWPSFTICLTVTAPCHSLSRTDTIQFCSKELTSSSLPLKMLGGFSNIQASRQVWHISYCYFCFLMRLPTV